MATENIGSENTKSNNIPINEIPDQQKQYNQESLKIPQNSQNVSNINTQI